MPDSVEVVDMVDDHLDEVFAIEEVTNPHPWSRTLFAAELRQAWSRSIVAVERRTVVGFGCLMYSGAEVHMTNLGVAPQHQRRGIGSLLLRSLADEAATFDVTAMTLEVRESNAAARALYERFGFVDAGRRPGYYASPTEDAVVMWLRDLRLAASGRGRASSAGSAPSRRGEGPTGPAL